MPGPAWPALLGLALALGFADALLAGGVASLLAAAATWLAASWVPARGPLLPPSGPAARAGASLLVAAALPLPEAGPARWGVAAALAPALLVGVGAPTLVGVLGVAAAVASVVVLGLDVAAVGGPTGVALAPAWTHPAGWLAPSVALGALGGLGTRGHGGRAALGLVALVVASLAVAFAWEADPAHGGAPSLARHAVAWSLPGLVALPALGGATRAERLAGAREGLAWLLVITAAGSAAAGWVVAVLVPAAVAAWIAPGTVRESPTRAALAAGAAALAVLTFPGVPDDGAAAGWAAAVFVALVWRAGLASPLPEAT